MSIVLDGLRQLKRPISATGVQRLHSLCEQLYASATARSKLRIMSHNGQILQFFVFAALTDEVKELSALPLSTIFDHLREEGAGGHQLKAVLKGAQELLAELRRPLERVRRVMLEYGHFRLIYLALGTLCQRFGLEVATRRRIWLCLIVLTSEQGKQGIDFMIELIGALLFLHCDEEQRAAFIDTFEDNTHYRVERTDLDRCCGEIAVAVPDLLSADFDAARYEQRYVGGLGACAINYLHFLESGPSAPGTPLPATPLNVVERPGQIIGRARTLRRSLALCRLPVLQDTAPSGCERQLLSPLVKREIDSLDYFRNHSEMLEWIKATVRDVELVRVAAEGEPELQVSAHFRQFAAISSVRRNFQCIAQLLKTVSAADVQLFTKFFFKILELLIAGERREGGKSALEESGFMTSLFAFCYELRLFVQLPTDARKLLACSRAYIDSALDFYKVLFSFSQLVYTGLPRLVKAHIYRLEYAVLLQELWRRPRTGEEYLPRRLYRGADEFYTLVLDKIRNFVAERLYLVLSALEVADESKDRVWETFDLLLAAGMGPADTETLYAFKFDIHLDTLLIAAITEWRVLYRWDFSLEQLYAVYLDKTLFPVASIREDAIAFLGRHKGVVASMAKAVKAPHASRRWELNTTPTLGGLENAQRKQRLGLSLVENLNLNLEKRPCLDYSSAAAPKFDAPQIFTEQTETRNAFSLGFKKIKMDDIKCELPAADHADEPDSNASPGTPDFG